MLNPKQGQRFFTDICFPKIEEVAISDFSPVAVCTDIKHSLTQLTDVQDFSVIPFLPKEDEILFAQSLVGRFNRDDNDPLLISTIRQEIINIINASLIGILSVDAVSLSKSSYRQTVEGVYQEKQLEEKWIDCEDAFFEDARQQKLYLLSHYVRNVSRHISYILGAQECPRCFAGVTPKDKFQNTVRDAMLAFMRTL